MADKDNEMYCTKDGVLYSKDMSRLIAYPNGKEDYSFEIPAEVDRIDGYEFGDNEYLSEIYVHETCSIDMSDIMSFTNIDEVHIIRD